jgi:hypothetical protein
VTREREKEWKAKEKPLDTVVGHSCHRLLSPDKRIGEV